MSSDDLQPSTDDPAAAAQVSERGTAKGDVSVAEPTRTQQTVARRVAESRATVPHFTVRADVDMEACATAREQRRDTGRGGGEAAPTYTHLIIKAAALALRDVPQLNASYRDNRFETYSRVNVGFTVATGDSFVTPTVFDADSKPIDVIAREARELVQAARDGTITARELGGATFTVANLGMHGVTDVEPAITAPQAAILGVGAITPRVVPGRDGSPAIRRLLQATLVCDHRIVTGVDAARFLGRLGELLEQPEQLLA